MILCFFLFFFSLPPPHIDAWQRVSSFRQLNMSVGVLAPPRSPFGLIQEDLWDRTLKEGCPDVYAWRMILCCVLLNRTRGKQVREIVWRLFDLFPSPSALIFRSRRQDHELMALLRPLGQCCFS